MRLEKDLAEKLELVPLSSFFPRLTSVVSQISSTSSFENERCNLQPILFTQLLGDTRWVLDIAKDSQMRSNNNHPQGIYDLMRCMKFIPQSSSFPQQLLMGLSPLRNPFPPDCTWLSLSPHSGLSSTVIPAETQPHTA